MNRKWEILAFCIISAALVATFLVTTPWGKTLLGRNEADRFEPCRKTVIAGGVDQIGGPFELTAQDGGRFNSASDLKEPSLLYFGYTFCPDVCPLDVIRNLDAVDILAQSGVSVTPVFISIDPKRDTVDALADYAENMHPKLIALTGTEDEIATASKAYRTYFKRHDKDSEDNYYLVDHSTFSYLVLPNHGFVEFFRREVSPQTLAKEMSCFISNS